MDVVREKLRNVLLGPMGRTTKIKTQFLQCEICTQYSISQTTYGKEMMICLKAKNRANVYLNLGK